ncbi:MAG: hypothetical protein ACREPI_12585, partial [Candidatus Dormibacterales bacterium]
RIERDGLGVSFHSRHHPLQDYLGALERNGPLVGALREVGEPAEAGPRRRIRWQRVPLFLHVRAVKRGPLTSGPATPPGGGSSTARPPG